MARRKKSNQAEQVEQSDQSDQLAATAESDARQVEQADDQLPTVEEAQHAADETGKQYLSREGWVFPSS